MIADEEGHVRPFAMVSQPGGELNSFPDLPPATAPADLESAAAAGAEAGESAALAGLGVTGVLGPVLDVSPEGGSALGALAYSDDPAEVAAFADAELAAYGEAGLFTAVAHFPGLGSADQSTDDGPASVGLGLPELRDRDLLPFRAAIEDGAPAFVLSHALYPMNDFTAPASLSSEVVTDLLRDELGYQGVAITDDLAAPAVEIAASVPEAAVEALRAGADMLMISGPAEDQHAAYDAVLAAVRRGRIPRRGWTRRWAGSWRPRRTTACSARARPRLQSRDLHAVVVEDRRVALLGEPLRRGGLAAAAALVVAVPPPHRRHQHARAGVVGHPRRAAEVTTVVVHPHAGPVGDAAVAGVVGVHAHVGSGCAECWRPWLANVELRKRCVLGVTSASG